MRGGVRGDFAGLEGLRRRLESIADPRFRLDLNKVCAEAAVTVLDDEFRTSSDPYYRPWKPLTSRVGKPLLDTGTHLRNPLAPKVTTTGFVVSTSWKGAAVHQYGAVIKPVNAKALAFRVRGAPTSRNKRGQFKATVAFAKSVTIPARPYMPEGYVGPRWGVAIGSAADGLIRRSMGRP